MADVYVVVHFATTCDDTAIYVPRDAREAVVFSWCTVDASSLEVLPQQTILVKPANTPITPEFTRRYKLLADDVKESPGLKDAVAQLDRGISAATAGRDFSFVTADIHTLRVLLPREARDKLVVLPASLQHPRVFDLFNEYLKWQATHPEAMSYPASSLSNIVTALEVDTPPGWAADACDDSRLTATVYARILVNLAKKSVPVSLHEHVLTKPYDAALDAKIFLAERSKTLHLANIPPDASQLDLEGWFGQYGPRPVAFWALKNNDVEAKNQQRYHKSKGLAGFVIFAKHEEAAEALFMNGRILLDRVIEVQPSSTRVLDRAAELLTSLPPSKNRPRPGDWTCPLCGFSNFQRRIACFRCLFPATSAVAIHEQIYTNPNGETGANMRRHKSEDKQAGYGYDYQPSMKHGNAYNYNYNGAHGQKPHYGNSVPFRAGDWKCVNESCQYHNFAKNSSCLKCGAIKPTSAAQNHSTMNMARGPNGAPSGPLNNTLHSVNSTLTAIAAATASGQPLNLTNSYMSHTHSNSGHARNSPKSSSSPIHGGLYSNISQLQHMQFQQGKQQMHDGENSPYAQGRFKHHASTNNQHNGSGAAHAGNSYSKHSTASDTESDERLRINLLSSQVDSLNLKQA